MTDTEYAQLATQGYDPNLEHQLIERGRELRPSPEAGANSGIDTRQITPDRSGVGRVHGSVGRRQVNDSSARNRAAQHCKSLGNTFCKTN